MNQFDVSGIMMTYSEKVKNARNDERLKDIIRELKRELDLRRVTFSNPQN